MKKQDALTFKEIDAIVSEIISEIYANGKEVPSVQGAKVYIPPYNSLTKLTEESLCLD